MYMYGCMTRVTCFLSSCMHLLTSLSNIRRWVYWIMYIWIHNLFSLLMHLLTSLPTSEGEIYCSNLFLSSCICSLHCYANIRGWVYWIVYDGCMTRVTCFRSSCICSLHCQHQAVSLLNCVCIWMHKSNLFLFSSAYFITKHQKVSLLNFVCMDAWPE